jgi:hypothetical protein
MLGALSPIKLAGPDEMAYAGTGTSMVPVDTDSQGNDIVPAETMGPMDSLRAIFEEIRDGINQLVELAYTGPRVEGPTADEMVADADADLLEPDSQGNDPVPDDTGEGGGFPFKIPKPGPKLGLALLIGGFAALLKFGDKLVPILAPVLKFIKEDVLPVAIDLATKAFEGVKTVFTYLYDNVWPFIRDNVITNAIDFVKDAFDGLSNLFTGIYDKILVIFGGKNADGSDATVLDKLTALGGIFTDFGSFIVGIGDSLITNVLEMFGVNFAPYDSAGAWVLGKLNEMWTGITTFFTDAGEFIVEGFTGAYDFVSKKVMSAFTAVGTWFSETGTFLLEGATGIVDWIKGKLEAPFAFLKDLFSFPDSPEGFATKLIDIVLLPYNLAINFIRGIFGFGEDEEGNLEPFSLGEFIIDTAKDAIAWFKGLFTFGDGDSMFNLPNIGDAFMSMIGKLLPSPDSWIGGALYKIPGTGTLKKAAEMFAAGGSIEGGVMTMGSAEENLANGTGTERSALEQIKRNQMNMDIYDDYDSDKVLKDGSTVESKLFELEMQNAQLASQLTGAELAKLQDFQERQGYAQGGGIAVNTFNTDNSSTDNSNTNTTGDYNVEGSDSTARALAYSGYSDTGDF